MRALLGGSSLSGQALVRELRQRGTINLEQANALASFWDAKSRAEDVAYKPTLTDVGFARAGYNELVRIVNETSNSSQPASDSTAASTFAPGGVAAGAAAAAAAGRAPGATTPRPAGTATAPAAEPVVTSGSSPVARMRSRPLPMLVAGLILLLLAGAAIAYFTSGRSHYDADMANAVNLMQTGRTEAARSAFATVAHTYPDKAAPHVFLARIARNDSPPDMNTARQELVTAIRIDPTYEPAQREMGVFQLADHNPSLARNFLTRAVQLAPGDSAAQGFLGCAMVRLNRMDLAQKFLARAGTGTWSSCATMAPTPSPVP